MNERIQELSSQAHDIAREYVADCEKYGFYMEHNEYDLQFEAKFAELIVRECAAICEEIAGMAEVTNTGEMARKTKATAISCSNFIKNRFGVK